MISWFSGLPPLIAFILSIIHPIGGLFPGSGIIAGFTWYSLYRYYAGGYSINEVYIERRERNHGLVSKFRKLFAVAAGMMLEAVAPWYALISLPKGFEVIKKDENMRGVIIYERESVELINY